jgi:hypothetical protein
LVDTATLAATVKDANDSTMAGATVTWASSDTTAATVSATGLVTAALNGTATITAISGPASTTAAVTVAFPQLGITTASLPFGAVDTAYATTLTATGGGSPFVWSIASGTLPDGLTLSGDTISGTPTTAASNTEGYAYTDTLTSTFTVQVTSGDAQTVTKELSLSVFDSLVIDITLLDPGNFRKGDPYTRTVKARGGDGVYTWSVASGSLPPGLSLQKRNNCCSSSPEFVLVQGTPTAAGSFEVTLGVESGDGQSATKAVTITVTLIG